MTLPVEHQLTFFDESRFLSSLGPKTKSGILKAFAHCLAEDPEIRHPDVLLEALDAREKLGSTAIGKGVAIPHSRTLSVPRLKALIARAPKGVEWDAPDGKPVKLFFVVVAPPQERSNDYLPLLGTLVRAMQDEARRDAVLKARGWGPLEAALEEAFRG